MKRLSHIVMLLALGLVLFSCSDKDKDQEKALEKEVLDIHDEVMPKMRDIENLKKELTERQESLDSLADEQARLLEELTTQLNESGESMMDWMRNYSREFKEMKHEEIMKYLEDQKEKVQEVKERVNNAIDAVHRELED